VGTTNTSRATRPGTTAGAIPRTTLPPTPLIGFTATALTPDADANAYHRPKAHLHEEGEPRVRVLPVSFRHLLLSLCGPGHHQRRAVCLDTGERASVQCNCQLHSHAPPQHLTRIPLFPSLSTAQETPRRVSSPHLSVSLHLFPSPDPLHYDSHRRHVPLVLRNTRGRHPDHQMSSVTYSPSLLHLKL
jgi:hypothetical protein